MAPSEDLRDEIEAINSIYGEGTLVLADSELSGSGKDNSGIFTKLAVPVSAEDVASTEGDGETASTAHRLCLRVFFPSSYPSCPDPPAVRGVQSVGDTGHKRPGAAAHDVERFGAALATTFQEGQVCLFDAVEEFLRQKAEDEEARSDEKNEIVEHATEDAVRSPLPQQQLSEPPPWTVAEPIVELKSTFVARCAPVSSPTQAAAYIQHLKDTDKRVRTATHNMTAWRIKGRDSARVTYQDCDDDGETAAGGRLLHLMQLMDLWDVVVVVTRWYGGHKLGPRRFALINQAARDAFVHAGLVAVAEPGKKK